MILKKNEENAMDEENNIIKVSQKIDEIIYILKIYLSKDKQSLIFKVEQECIQTYYYYEKFQIFELKQNHKRFNKLNTLTEIYQNIKSITDKSTAKFEIESLNKIKITFVNKSETLLDLTLRKKILSQNRLNALIIGQLEENKSKIKSNKKNANKMEKTIKEQNDIINDINSKIEIMSEKLENIIKDIDNIKNTVKKLSTNYQNNLDKYDEKKNKNNKNNNSKEYKENNNKNKNSPEINNTTNKSCCKIYEIIFILNLLIIVFIAHIILKLKKIDEKETIDKKTLERLKKKYSFLTYLADMKEEDLLYIQNTFDTGEILNDEKEEDDSINNDSEKEGNEDKKNIDLKKKLFDKKKKSKLKEDNNKDDDTGTFNVNFDDKLE